MGVDKNAICFPGWSAGHLAITGIPPGPPASGAGTSHCLCLCLEGLPGAPTAGNAVKWTSASCPQALHSPLRLARGARSWAGREAQPGSWVWLGVTRRQHETFHHEACFGCGPACTWSCFRRMSKLYINQSFHSENSDQFLSNIHVDVSWNILICSFGEKVPEKRMGLSQSNERSTVRVGG